MTEIKKPHPDNKHETRLVTEARPAGAAASTYREEPGRSVDMIEVVGEKPQVTRISQGAYERMVRDGTEFYARDFIGSVPAGAATDVWTPIANLLATGAHPFTVPRGMALDITRLHFWAAKLITPSWFLFDDEAVLGYAIFRVAVSGVTPWDVQITSNVGVLSPVQLGLPWLNRDHLMLGGDCPVHLVATEGQRVALEYYHYNGVLQTVLDGNANTLAWAGCLRGRWIPIQHYNRIVHANALE